MSKLNFVCSCCNHNFDVVLFGAPSGNGWCLFCEKEFDDMVTDHFRQYSYPQYRYVDLGYRKMLFEWQVYMFQIDYGVPRPVSHLQVGSFKYLGDFL